MSELLVIPVRSTRTIVEQYLGEHLADLDPAAAEPDANAEATVLRVPAADSQAESVAETLLVPAAAQEAVAEALPAAAAPQVAAISVEPESESTAEPGPETAPGSESGAEPDPSEMLAFRAGPLRFALPNAAVAVAAADGAPSVDIVSLVPAAYEAIAAAGRGAESVALACGVILTGVHREGVAIVTPAEIRSREQRASEPWIRGTTAKPARFILDVDALAQAFGRR